jgi:hypothetical protein
MDEPITIPKHPELPPSQDYLFLRQKGLQYIEQLGSRRWTDYNIHDPGITILELLCYALTDLGYRTGFDIRDLLAESLEAGGQDQGFFTARNILTVNPVTVNDFRKLLVDLNGVRNAWLLCKECACELLVYANCEEQRLTYVQTDHPVIPRGTYEVLLEMEDDPQLGDFNNGKIKQRVSVFLPVEATFVTMLLEVRFPAWRQVRKEYARFRTFLGEESQLKEGGVTVTKIARLSDPSIDLQGQTVPVRALRTPWLVSLEIIFHPDPDDLTVEETLVLEDVPFSVFPEPGDPRKHLAVQDWADSFASTSETGLVASFLRKLQTVRSLVAEAKETLHRHRNLGEDFCTVSPVAVEDLAVCADVELTPDADIEKVLAAIYFEIEQYFNPPLRFYSLPELLNQGLRTDEIFDGPALEHGFLKTEEIEASQLRRQVFSSDIINRLVEIEGVVAVTNLQLTKYDAQGSPLLPSQPWSLNISPGHQPRLYLEQSKVLFFKNGLPFLPANQQEVWATLQQLRSTNEAVKWLLPEKDLPVPTGTVRELEDYFPVQHSFPLTYGIGPEGLPEEVTPARKAQARQLKAFLLFFEQLLVNFLAQLANTRQLFSLDETVRRSYFSRFLDDSVIPGMEGPGGLYQGLTSAVLADLLETEEAGLRRRNRMLDHLLARFGEQFTDYALMLYSVSADGADPQQLSYIGHVQEKLLQDKINFLKEYPALSANRGRGFHYLDKINFCDPNNVSGLQRRLIRLLGLADDEVLFIVEHLLLRPRLFGQALLPVCLDPGCEACGEEDPYSFRLTLVLPGWLRVFRNLDFRRFAERTIRLETPAHLASRICWVGNEVCRGEGDEAILCQLRTVLSAHLNDPSKEEELDLALCRFAETVLEAYNAAFREKFVSNGFQPIPPADLERLFEDEVRPLELPSAISAEVKPAYADALKATLTTYFEGKEGCFQFNQFWKAWCEWLAELNQQDPDETPLDAQAETLHTRHLQEAGLPFTSTAVCSCVRKLLAAFGDALRAWLGTGDNANQDLSEAEWEGQLADLHAESVEVKPFSCGVALSSAFRADLKELLLAFYGPKRVLLQKHALLLGVLGQLKSIYPPATLHDCEDDNDENPVRLNNTALG